MAVETNVGTEKRRKLGRRLWIWAVCLCIVTQAMPVRTGSIRLFILLDTAAIWAGALTLFWGRKAVRAACIGLALLTAALLLGPGRAEDPYALRREYIERLKAYQGTRYIWGGETRVGVDCSGLVRIGLIDADLRRGLTTLNPACIRQGLALWWYDCSAEQLKNGYRGGTRLLEKTENLNVLDYSRLVPGDIAVADSGIHTLAYIGDRTWIEADPTPGSVITTRVPAKGFSFNQPMDIMTWRQFDPTRGGR